MGDKLLAKTVKITSLENLFVYSIIFNGNTFIVSLGIFDCMQ